MRRLLFAFLLVWAAVQFGCGGLSANSSKSAGPDPPPAGIAVSVSPNPANVRMGGSQQFNATVTGSTNTSVTWFVNGVSGGNTATGTISSSGLFTPPGNLPNPNTVTVKAVSAADANASASRTATLLNPIPVLNNVVPQTVAVGAFAVTVNGASFVQGAQCCFQARR